MWRPNRALFGCLLLVASFSFAEGTDDNTHVWDDTDAEISAEELMKRHPELMQIQEMIGSPIVPLDLVIRQFPDLWTRMKNDPPVWRWLQQNLPEYTIDRVEGSREMEHPYGGLSHDIKFMYDIEESLVEAYGRKEVRNAPIPTGAEAADLYSHYQELKWMDKNFKRASGGAKTVARAWESHSIDRDYPEWMERYGIKAGARVLDIGTEMGHQSIQLAKMGYTVVGTDVGAAELEVARGYLERESEDVRRRVTFIQDNILEASGSALEDASFDVIFDRAVYHCMAPFVMAEPRLRSAVDERFAKRIKSLLKPGGIFVFKGMADTELGFRQEGLGELNPLSAFHVTKILVSHFGGIREAQTIIEGVNASAREDIYAIASLASEFDSSFHPETTFIDLSTHFMPHHFTAYDMKDIFEDRMCFTKLDGGESYLYNNKAGLEMMPKARYVILRDGGDQNCDYGKHRRDGETVGAWIASIGATSFLAFVLVVGIKRTVWPNKPRSASRFVHRAKKTVMKQVLSKKKKK
eukprot:g2636.t1